MRERKKETERKREKERERERVRERARKREREIKKAREEQTSEVRLETSYKKYIFNYSRLPSLCSYVHYNI